MYCMACGEIASSQAHYCGQCGAPLDDAITADDMTSIPMPHHAKPVFVLKPRSVPFIICMRYLPMQLNFSLTGGLIFGLLVVVYHFFTGTSIHPFRPFIFFGCFFFITILCMLMLSYFKTIKSVRYEFYKDRVEYYDGFWHVHQKVLYYKHISEIRLKRNLFQRCLNLGTVHLTVPTMGTNYPGLYIWDIEHPRENLEKIEKLVRFY